MKAYGNGMVWNVETDSLLVKFVKGEAEVNAEQARKLRELGYKVDEDTPAEAVVEAEPEVDNADAEAEADQPKSRRRR